MTQNPLLIGHGLPPFAEIKAEHVEPAVTTLLTELEQQVSDLETNLKPTWTDFVEPLTQLEEKLMWTWG